jgi:DNA-binding response OmpR family regulator
MCRVVVIENDTSLIRLMSWFLREEGYEVTVARAHDDIGAVIAQHQPDVVVFNTEISNETKRVWIEGWRQLAPTCRVINIIGVDHDADVGADRTLAMPLYVDTLMDSVRELTGRDD